MQDFKEIDREFDKDFPPFIGSGAPFPIFNETPNREHIKDFWHSKLSAAYEQGREDERKVVAAYRKGFNDFFDAVQRGKTATLRECPRCNGNGKFSIGSPESTFQGIEDCYLCKGIGKVLTPPQEHE